ncbi:MAG: 4-(cytidine 5'-diphospho)-2-C-methyl-D-erythritol kinase [Phycisphaerales bacterium]
MEPGGHISARAYAKVNLALAVGPPLPAGAGGGAHAGFHPICSWMHAIDLFDELELTRLPAGESSRYDISWAADAPRPSPIDWPVEKDLCMRAHRAIEARAGRTLPLALTLRKRTPVGGGLGGGSSDAAAMIRAVDTMFDLHVSDQARAAIARSLGSDVLFFLSAPALDQPPAAAIVSGLGDVLETVPKARAWLALILPPMGCPTGPVYRAFDALPHAPLREQQVRALTAGAAAHDGRVDTAGLFNDLAEPAFTVAPGLRQIRDRAALALRRPVHVTGSGSTLFAVCESSAEAQAACDRVAAGEGTVRTLACALV